MSFIPFFFTQRKALTFADIERYPRKCSSNSNSFRVIMPDFPLKAESLLSGMHKAPFIVSAVICKLDPLKTCGLNRISTIVFKEGTQK